MKMDLPNKKYSVIYADPPWQYDSNRFLRGNVNKKYDVLTHEDLCQIPVSEISEDDCLLFLWVVSPRLPKCIEVGESWGFKYITIGFVWDKGVPMVGHYTLSETELCLIFKKGKIPKPRGARNMRQLIEARKGPHSVKPLEAKNRIQKMFPEQDKIELFARPGLLKYGDHNWDYWGDEV